MGFIWRLRVLTQEREGTNVDADIFSLAHMVVLQGSTVVDEDFSFIELSTIDCSTILWLQLGRY
jgi:hypothetical protein